MAKDTMTFAGRFYRALNWANNITITDLVRYWYYHPEQDADYNNRNCSVWFEELMTPPAIGVSIDGITADGLPVQLFNPWEPRHPSSGWFDFPTTRFRFSDYWTTAEDYRRSAPFRPKFGVFGDLFPSISSEYNNSYYRLAVPMALDAETGLEYDPSGPQSLRPGDAVFRQWSTDATKHTFYYDTTQSPWETISIRFSDNDQRITAEYKGYLLADSTLSSNGQRKLVHDGSNYWFLYESIGTSWLTSSRNPETEGWRAEAEIPGLPDGATSCLDVRDGIVVIAAANAAHWKFRLVDPQTMDISRDIDVPLASGVKLRHAVIAKKSGAHSIVSIAQATSPQSGDHLALVLLHSNTGEAEDYQIQTMIELSPARGGAPANPTLACDNSGAFHLAWEEDSAIYYTRFLVDPSGNIDSLYTLYPDVLPVCAALMHGRNPSIAVDAWNRPHVAWETELRQITDGSLWLTFSTASFGRVIAHRYKTRPFSDPASAASWSRELLLAIKDRDSYGPVIGADRIDAAKVGITWWTVEDSGRVHVALAENDASGIQSWKRKTLEQSCGGAHLAIRNGGNPLLVFSRPDGRLSDGLYQMHFSQDTNDVDFQIPPVIAPMEMRGSIVQNDLFTTGVYYRMYEDSSSGESIDFIPVSDTTRIQLYVEIPDVVRSTTITTSHLLFDVCRFVHGISPGADSQLFDSVSVSWWAVIRNADNDTVVCAVKLGELARDSSFVGVDSVRVSFPHQPVYSEMVVETNVDAFPCVAWAGNVSIPRSEAEYSTQKSATVESRSLDQVAELEPATPNPFNSRTRITFTLRTEGPVRLTVHDALGRLVAVLEDGMQTSGMHSRMFDGSALSNGMYVYRLVAGGQSTSRQMYLIR